MNNFFSRIIQFFMSIFKRVVKFREPMELNNVEEVNNIIINNKYNNILVVCGPRFSKTDVYNNFVSALCIKPYIVDRITPDPDVDLIEGIFEELKDKKIDFIIGIGGGSTLDASKAIAARLSNPKKHTSKLMGMMKVTRKPITQLLIPTTAGTGSECTVAAVISDHENKKKRAVGDFKLIPEYMMYMPEALVTLPKNLTATTGMDALTHAVEAYINKFNEKKNLDNALEAIKLIDKNLVNSYNNPENITYRKNMLVASYKAGLAFTSAFVGYVHAISHAIAANYNLPHGMLNAVILPHVLKSYKGITDKLSTLNKAIENQDGTFIDYIINIDKAMNIPEKLDIEVDDAMFEKMYKHIKKEVYPLYPVPSYLTKQQVKDIIKGVTK